MKQTRRLTRSQKEALRKNGMDSTGYGFHSEKGLYFKVVHSESGRIKVIPKYRRGGNKDEAANN